MALQKRDLEKFTSKEHLLDVAENFHKMCRQIGQNELTLGPSVCTGVPQASIPVKLIPELRVNIEDLKLSVDKVILGKYFLCRIIGPSYKLTSLQLVVDDPEGELGVSLYLYNYTNIPATDLNLIEQIFPVGTVLAIMNPFFKRTADGGFGVRCDNPTEVVVIEDSSSFGISWKSEVPLKYNQNCKEKLAIDHLPDTIEGCRSLGSQQFNEKKYLEALRIYDHGLKLSPNNVDMLANKSITNIKLENFEEALENAEAVLNIKPDHLKALHRKAVSLIELEKYKEAIIFLDNATQGETLSSRIMLVDLKNKLKNQLSGIYDMNYFVDKKYDHNMKSYPACAQYFGPVKVAKKPGKGKGLFATDTIKTGQLILACKAFAYFDPLHVNKGNVGNVSLDVNLETSLAYGPHHRELVNLIVRKLLKYPELSREFYGLYAGPKMKYLGTKKARDVKSLDMRRIDQICHYNSGSVALGIDLINDNNQLRQASSAGIWLLPSFVQHSCINNNVLINIMKDFLFIRAIKDIGIGEELTRWIVSPMASYIERLQKFKFGCDCHLCLLDRNEPESVHKSRAKILAAVEAIPNGPLQRYQMVALKRYLKKLENLRPCSELNFPLYFVEQKLSRAYHASGQFLEAAKSYQRLYNLCSRYTCPGALDAAVDAVTVYLLAEKRKEAAQWIPRWKEQLQLMYGCDTVNFYDDVKALLVANGLAF